MKKIAQIGLPCVALVGALAWRVGGLPLNIVTEGTHATAHMEFLGEYPNNVKLVELKQLNPPRVIWRAVADKEMVQLHQIPFVVGSNPTNLQTTWGHAKTEVPSNSSEFVLTSNTDYELRVCPPAWWQRCVYETFRLSDNNGG